MKAKIKATGEYIEVEQRGSTFLNTNDGSLYNVKELDLNVVDDMMSEQEKWYWKDKHIQAAIAAMQGMLANPQTFEQIDHDERYKEVCSGDKTKIVAKSSVMYADALVAELKRSDDVYAECRRMGAINTASVCENMTKIQNELQKKGGQDAR